MFPTFLKMPFLDMASSVWAMPEEQWIDDAAVKDDIEMLEKEIHNLEPHMFMFNFNSDIARQKQDKLKNFPHRNDPEARIPRTICAGWG
jgi:hypothetical protein